MVTGVNTAELESLATDYLNMAAQWYKNNYLQLNETKLQGICFQNHSTKKEPEHIDHISVNNNMLKLTDEITLLGVQLDNKLTFESHAKVIAQKVYWKCATVRKFRKCLSKNVIIKIFKTFIYPHFNYCNLLFTSAPMQTRNLVNSIFFRSCRTILSDYTSTHEDLLKQLQLNPPTMTRLVKQVAMLDKIIKKLALNLNERESRRYQFGEDGFPLYLLELFDLSQAASTRQLFRARKPNYKTVGGTTFAATSLRLWDFLPDMIKGDFSEIMAAEAFKEIHLHRDEFYGTS